MDQAAPCNGVMVAHVCGPLEPSVLRESLRLVRVRHPLLGARIVLGTSNNPKWPRYEATDGDDPASQEPPNLEIHQADGPILQKAIEVAEDLLNRPYAPLANADGTHELWRAALLVPTLSEEKAKAEKILILSHHHVTCDALSAVAHVRDVLSVAASLLVGEPVQTVRFPLRPSLQELSPAKGPRAVRFLSHFLYRHAIARLHGWPQKLFLESRPAPLERRTRILHLSIDERETQILTSRARELGTSVQGLLGASLLLGARQDLGLLHKGGKNIGCFSAVNLRADLQRMGEPISLSEIGLYISQATTFHRLHAKRSIGELARGFRDALAGTVRGGEPWVTLPWLGLFVPKGPSPLARFIRRIDLASPAAVGLTNIGKVGIPEHYGPLHLQRLHLCIGAALATPVVAAACTLSSKMSLNVLYVEPLLSRSRAEALQKAMIAELIR